MCFCVGWVSVVLNIEGIRKEVRVLNSLLNVFYANNSLYNKII